MYSAYLYVDGSDLEDCVAVLEPAFNELAQRWPGAIVVNQRDPRTPDLHPDDLPDWFLGVNFPIENFNSVRAEQIVTFARLYSASTGRDFVLGVASDSGITDDLVFLDSSSGELEQHILCTHLGELL